MNCPPQTIGLASPKYFGYMLTESTYKCKKQRSVAFKIGQNEFSADPAGEPIPVAAGRGRRGASARAANTLAPPLSKADSL